MIIKPIIPIAYMTIICVVLLLLKRKGAFAFVRQIIIVLLLFAINLRPMLPNGEVRTENVKLDAYVLFVIDDTISMLAEDYGDSGKTRMDGVREDCHYIINELSGASFATMIFHNDAKRLTAFSEDKDYMISVIDSIQPVSNLYARGSSLNTCQEMFLDLLKNAKSRENGKVIAFFLSDGEITSEDKLKSFRELNTWLDYGAVLGYGTEKGGQMHAPDYEGKPELVVDNSDWENYGATAISKLDEKNLKQIADDLGVDYISMGKQSRLDPLLQKIRRETSGEEESDKAIGYVDTYYYFAFCLFGMLVLEMFLYRKNKR